MPLDADRYPLYWPESWPRTEPHRREFTGRYKVALTQARDDLVSSLKLIGATDVVLSTNIPIRRDGLPRMDMPEPTDPGVAAYWVEGHGDKAKNRVIACDHWRKVRDNMRAVGLAVEALRALKRSGATQVAERAFTGLTALAAANPGRDWRAVLGFNGGKPTTEAINAAYRALALKRHPDHGGTAAELAELIEARNQALRAIP